ncbi:helix-turn-helix domain-containing protein [Butyricicoccus sp.]|uniref:helix-turn-helix domain-containing protein n=1 Tax=Butyricicoccus sp. TaxID=2049021 RepID=UPI003D7C95FF
MINLSHRLRNLRLEHHLTQKQLAKQMNVSVSTISAYETGRCNPSCAVLIRFICIFHVSADFLLGLSERDTRIFSLDKDEQNILNKLVSTLPTK